MAIILFILFSSILVMLVFMTYRLHSIANRQSAIGNRFEEIQGWLYAAIVFIIIAMIASIIFLVKGSPWEGHVMEWLNIGVRVMHFTFGIAWIGASFYFVFLENALNRKNVRDELAGDLWAVHGGGFYYLEKYKVAPKSIPKDLHWFKYEAYFTWLSGIGLLFIVYYLNASAMLLNPSTGISGLQGILIGLGSFGIAWILYDLLCKSPLKKNMLVFSLVCFLLLAGFAWFYSVVFNPRAAYIHFGAMVGSLMVANVFFVIIPSQKAMVNAARKGLKVEGERGKAALFRSIHNNYFTLPVLFVMVSNHFPSTFGNKYNWVVLALISLGAAGIKHWLNLREQGRLSFWVMPVSVLVLLATGYMTAPPKPGVCKSNIDFAVVNTIFQTRCISCHSSRPTDNFYKAPPNGVAHDTPLDIFKKKEGIMQRVVLTKTMPLNNKTNMTLEERETIRCWIEQGAEIK
jgi:uncharacterized membrane protein